MTLPTWMVQGHVREILGEVLADSDEQITEVEQAVLAGRGFRGRTAFLPRRSSWGTIWIAASLSEFRAIGRGMIAAERAARFRAARQRSLELRADLGLTGYKPPRLRHIPWKGRT
jgi:hypothetical protein